MKRIFCLLLITCICLGLGGCKPQKSEIEVKAKEVEFPDRNIKGCFVAGDDYFYKRNSLGFQKTYLCGVNMGLTEATTSLDDPDVSYDTYIEWFSQILQMNANTVKVFTVMPPQFYTALFDFNAGRDNPLYLLQGIWFNEEYMYTYGDVYDGTVIYEAFERACRETVDIVHGNSDYTSYGSIQNAIYDEDVTQYLAGFILGLEWDYDFIENSNAHTEISGYSGEYLYTAENATPFETFLCSIGDNLVRYQTETYDFQTPVAFLNWQTTDTLTHSNEPFEEEDRVSVNTENICFTPQFGAGLFAAVDVYPYYPEFMNHQPEYVSYIDAQTNKQNPYRAYLKDLITQYSVPVIIAEVGLPTSRGCAHESIIGYNQGGITEQQQGEYVSKMILDIHAEGYAGSMIFSWQDEWFKQTWNTVKYSPEDASMRTPNVMSAEQSYGILAMVAGDTDLNFCDGDFSDWDNAVQIAASDGYTLYCKYDAAYLYFYIRPSDNYNFQDNTILIPIRTIGVGSNQSQLYQTRFSESADFLLVINGRENTRILVDAYYDLFHYEYAVQRGVFDRNSSFSVPGSGIYNTINMFLSNEMTLPLTGQINPAKSYESGLLRFGINNPENVEYDSMADFYGSEDGIEVRIPWYLLNVINPALKVAVGDMYQLEEVSFTTFSSIHAGIGLIDYSEIQLFDTGYSGLQEVTYHTRLKKSYEILKETIALLSDR